MNRLDSEHTHRFWWTTKTARLPNTDVKIAIRPTWPGILWILSSMFRSHYAKGEAEASDSLGLMVVEDRPADTNRLPITRATIANLGGFLIEPHEMTQPATSVSSMPV
jgi:hypothetical protein